jgi:hypothetical protein
VVIALAGTLSTVGTALFVLVALLVVVMMTVIMVTGIGLVELVIMMVYGIEGFVVRFRVCGGHDGI